jgi:glutathione S-transferase
LDAFDVILGKQRYLAGDVGILIISLFTRYFLIFFLGQKFTLADLFAIPYGSMLTLADVDILEDVKRPNVARWWKEITARPTWQAVKARGALPEIKGH